MPSTLNAEKEAQEEVRPDREEEPKSPSGQPARPKEGVQTRLMPDRREGGKLQFQRGGSYAAQSDASAAESGPFPSDPEGNGESVSSPSPGESAPTPSRLRFEGEPPPGGARGKTSSADQNAKRRRLRFEDAPEPDAAANLGPSLHRQKRVEKAQQRVEQAEKKLEKAQDKLPTRYRVRVDRQFDRETGTVHRRLRFEKEAAPEGSRSMLPTRAGGGALRSVKTQAHEKIQEVESENTAVEAAHKTELTVEREAGQLIRRGKSRLRSRPYRAARRSESRVAHEKARLAWQAALRDNQAVWQRETAFAKMMEKKKLKRKYAQAARKAQQNAQRVQRGAQAVVSITSTIGRAVARVVRTILKSKTVRFALLIIGVLLLLVMMILACCSSCSSGAAASTSAILYSSYLAEDGDINESDLYYTELETDLQITINNTETDYPGYDEYRYNIGEIGHNPYELMAYLTVNHNDFTFAMVESELDALFRKQYTLTRVPATETLYDENGVPYDWIVLQTTLTVRPLSDIIAEDFSVEDTEERTQRYELLMQTYGGRQEFENPFDFSWLRCVSSDYGYRVHPISGEKNLHRGLDLAVPQGTPIKAIQDGKVVSAGEAGSYGLCIVIKNDEGYQSRYAHCSSLSVTAGQTVKCGDIIGAVGSTGNSTGPHLHLEVMRNGEYLNPYFYVDNGDDGSGTTEGPSLPDDAGDAMGDGSFAAMLAEAEKYLGYPYVWGGSNPTTSFDCSGFVSWVINHSGVGNVGRQTAQGLYNLCTPVSRANAQPGDLIFFTRTYQTSNPVTHVGIYVGNGQMIHCGDPVSYANINSNYWTQHFYSFGRLP